MSSCDQRARGFSAVIEIVHAVAEARDREQLLLALAHAFRIAVPAADLVSFVLLREDERTLAYSFSDPPLVISSTRLADYYRPREAWEGRGPAFVRSSDLVGFPVHQKMWADHGIEQALVIPLLIEERRVGAVLCNARAPGGFDGIDLECVKDVAATVAIGIDNFLACEQAARLRDRAVDANSALRQELAALSSTELVRGSSPAYAALREQIALVAPSSATVLLTGETGSGKDVVARAIHAASGRRERPMVTVNCASLPARLAESELFGHEEGAFTGASRARAGRFELANGTTLFLDEVGELGLDIQAKLLRVLQEREVQRVGGSDVIPVDVRIVAATNRDLRAMIAAGTFREDLYYRIAVFPIHLPPLRARREDVPALVDAFVERAAARLRVPPRRVTPDAMRRLAEYDWPGNVRELENAIERAMIISAGPTLDIATVVPKPARSPIRNPSPP